MAMLISFLLWHSLAIRATWLPHRKTLRVVGVNLDDCVFFTLGNPLLGHELVRPRGISIPSRRVLLGSLQHQHRTQRKSTEKVKTRLGQLVNTETQQLCKRPVRTLMSVMRNEFLGPTTSRSTFQCHEWACTVPPTPHHMG